MHFQLNSEHVRSFESCLRHSATNAADPAVTPASDKIEGFSGEVMVYVLMYEKWHVPLSIEFIYRKQHIDELHYILRDKCLDIVSKDREKSRDHNDIHISVALY